jgi:hypothetical protein
MVGGEHDQAEGALDLGERCPHGKLQVAVLLVECADEDCQNLGIGIGDKAVAVFEQLCLEDGVVFDDAVVHDCDAPSGVRMRVGIAVYGLPVGCPARVCPIPMVAGKFRCSSIAARWATVPARLAMKSPPPWGTAMPAES